MKEFIIFIDVLMILITIIKILKIKNKEKNKHSKRSILFNSNNSDNGVPANIIFEQLKDIEIDYLGMKNK